MGVLAGWRTNLARVSSPALGAEVLWRTPLLRGRLLVGARASWYGERATVPAGAGAAPVASSAQVFPLAAVALHEWPLGWATVRAGAGVGADLTWLSVGRASELVASPSALLLLNGSRRLGPGEAVLEVAASAGSMEASTASLRTSGLSLSAGYRLRP
ncbi:MAG TPA: hypothetical protein VFI16_04385 [Anaeromyxobacteraceae bacterium]|nr:hypothetical protein [Anaeromyxobacteraceae bacterium]